MKFCILYSALLCTAGLLTSCKSPNTTVGNSIFKIDSTIKLKAIQEIKKNEGSTRCECSSKHNAQFYQNDSLVEEIKDQSPDGFFQPNYWWHNDTLTFAAIGGWLSSGGFVANIYQGKMVTAYYSVCAHESNMYKVEISDTLSRCIDVPLYNSELIISNIPHKNQGEDVFGFVSF